MKVLFSFLLLLTFASQHSYVNAQVEYPEDKAKWTFKVEQKGCEATIIAEVAIVP